MEIQKERVLLVEADGEISEVIAQQTLRPLGYHVDVIESASSALKEIDKLSPDILITNLNLPGISGKDLMVALSSQGVDIPTIIIAQKGHESEVLQAFRLGAIDYITYPLREAEVVRVVEASLRQIRKQNELEQYAQRLAQSKEDMDQKIQNLTEIFSIAKQFSFTSNQTFPYEKITSAAHQVTQADAAWLAVVEPKSRKFILRDAFNVGEELLLKLNLPYEDGIISRLAASGQGVSLHGDVVKRYTLPEWIGSILALPLKRNYEVIGILAVSRRADVPFNHEHQALLEMVAEYASTLFENASRYHQLEQRLNYVQQSSIFNTIDAHLKNDFLYQIGRELRKPLIKTIENLELLSTQDEQWSNTRKTGVLPTLRSEASVITEISDALLRIRQGDTKQTLETIDLDEIARQVFIRSQAIAQASRIQLKLELPTKPARVTVFASQITHVVEGMFSNALKFAPSNSQVTIRIEIKENCALMMVKNQGDGINEDLVQKLFDSKFSLFTEEAKRFGGIGISLPMMKEVISAHRGEIWIDSGYGKGFTITFTLPFKFAQPDQT